MNVSFTCDLIVETHRQEKRDTLSDIKWKPRQKDHIFELRKKVINQNGYCEITYIVLIFCIAVNKLHLYYSCEDPDDDRNWKRIEEFKEIHPDDVEKTAEDQLAQLLQQGSCIDFQRTNRKLEAVLALVVWFKILYFLQLSDNFAPLVQVIFAIIWEIRWFLGVTIIIVAGFANAFYMLGLNQMAFDGIPIGQHPIYSTGKGSVIFIFKLVVYLEPGLEYFNKSATYPPRNTMSTELWSLWAIGVFIMIIHLFNMLIGMLGNIQGEESEKQKMFTLKYKLNVVVDNWWINAIDPKGLKYIISATTMSDDEEYDMKQLSELRKDVHDLREKHKLTLKHEVEKIMSLQYVMEK